MRSFLGWGLEGIEKCQLHPLDDAYPFIKYYMYRLILIRILAYCNQYFSNLNIDYNKEHKTNQKKNFHCN